MKAHDIIYFFSLGATVSQWARASSFTRFLDHTQRRTTVGRTTLNKWPARRRDLYLTTHNTHNRQTSLPPVGFEPTISAGERPLGPAIWYTYQLQLGWNPVAVVQYTFTHKYSYQRTLSHINVKLTSTRCPLVTRMRVLKIKLWRCAIYTWCGGTIITQIQVKLVCWSLLFWFWFVKPPNVWWLLYVLPYLSVRNPAFNPHVAFPRFLCISGQEEIISLYSINSLVFTTEIKYLYFAVRNL
jgi:hypothetical protein